MKVNFEQLTPLLQEKILALMQARFLYKGEPSTKEYALRAISRKQSKTRKQWRAKVYYYMKAIDVHRKKLGIEPLYSPDLTVIPTGDKLGIGSTSRPPV